MYDRSIKIVALLLAAGQSRRLGIPKQILIWQDGLSLLEGTAKKLQETNIHSLWITTNEDDRVINCATKMSRHIIKITNQENLGIGASLKNGLQAIIDNEKNVEACLITVCDQVLILASEYQALLIEFCKTRNMVCARYGTNFGVPCIIPNRYFSDLLSLSEDYGAKKLVQKELLSTGQVSFIDMASAEFDIDTSADLQKARHYQMIHFARSLDA